MPTNRPDEDGRREFWRVRLDEAYDFMRNIMPLPVAECMEPLASIADATAAAGVAVTFSAKPHVDGLPRLFYLRRGLMPALMGVAREMNSRGWVLHVEDAYRTVAMQTGLWRQDYTFDRILAKLRWELGGRAPDEEFMFRRVAALLAPWPKAGTHLAGSAVDISVFRRDGAGEVDRGGPYIELSELTPMDSPFVGPDAAANRRQITDIFGRFGFVPYPWEFWHYSGGDIYESYFKRTGRPARYGPVNLDIATGQVTPVANIAEPFMSLDDIRKLISRVLSKGSG